jgi:prephenate dehydrogenase
VPWKKVTIAGLGLLGGSLGMALRQRGLAKEVTGLVRRRAAIREVVRSGAADRATLNVQDAVEHADLVVLCTPVAQMRPLLEQILPHLHPGAIITDVGSERQTGARS